MKITITYILLLLSVMAFAQKFELGKVSIAELREKTYASNPAAAAAVLNKTGNSVFNYGDDGRWIILTNVKVKTKIYNRNGYKYAVVSIPYIQGKETIEVYEAVTYNTDGDKVSKTKNITRQDNSKGTKGNYQLEFSDVKDGSIIEYGYTIKSANITNLRDWYFQEDIPVIKNEYTIAIPDFFMYNKVLSPYFPVKESKEKTDRVLRYNSMSSKGTSGTSNIGLMSGGGRIAFKENVFTYTAQDVPAFITDKYTDNGKNYVSVIRHQLASTEIPGQPYKKYDSDWNTVIKGINGQQNFGGELAKDAYFVKDIDNVIKDVASNTEKIKAVFDYVKNRMAWNGEYSYETKKGVAKAYADKTGNAAEINLMLVSMLRYAGFVANPVLISTRDKGQADFITPDAFNYVIATVELKNGVILLDATSKNTQPDVLPARALTYSGMKVSQNGTYQEINVMPKAISKKNTAIVASVLPDGTLSGEIKNQYTDYNAFIFRENYKNSAIPDIEGMQVTKYTANNIADYTKPVTEDITFISDNAAEVREGKIYLLPLLFYTMNENPFTAETRSYPIDFMYPQQERYTISLTIPQGYEAEILPDAAGFAMDNGFMAFKYSISKKGNQIQVIAVKNTNAAVTGPDMYKDVKSFYRRLAEQQNKKIVLKKA